MTQVVIGDILPYTQATAIASQTVFGTNWTANSASDVVVYQTPNGDAPDDATQILMSSQYSVAFIGDSEEVQVTLVTPANAGDIITITRQTPADRMNLYSNTNFTPDMLNQDFGILTLVDQQAQLVNQWIGPRYNYSATAVVGVDNILPILGENQLWMMNSTRTAIIAVDISAISTGIVNVGLQNQLAYYPANGNEVSGLSYSNVAGNVLQANHNAPPTWSSAIYPSTTVANQILYSSNTNTIVGLPTANSSTLITDSGGVPSFSQTLPSAVQTNITKLGTQSQALNMGTNLINNVSTPLIGSDAANKAYVDSIAAGLNPVEAVKAATTANLNATYNNGVSGVGATLTNSGAQAAFVLDGYSGNLNDRFLIKDETTPAWNGIYNLTTVGSPSTNWVLTRATDYNTPSQIAPGDFVAVINGTTNAGSSWVETANVSTIGTDAINFSVFFNPANYAGSGANNNITSMTGLTGILQAPAAIASSAGINLLSLTYTASAVNYFQIANAATTSTPVFSVTGTDANVGMSIGSKNSAINILDITSTSSGKINFRNAANSHGTTLTVATAQSTDLTLSLPAADAASSGGVMQSNAAGQLSFSTATYPTTTTINQLLYSSSANVVTGLSTVNNGLLSTTSGGVPQIQSTTPVDITGSITVAGFSGSPTVVARNLVVGKMCYLEFTISGTSNSTSFTISGLPHAINATIGTQFYPILVTNNATNSFGLAVLTGTGITFYLSPSSNIWTASGSKAAYGAFWYSLA